MDKEKNIASQEQQTVNNIWRQSWSPKNIPTIKELFGHRLFLEGYPIFKKYILRGQKMEILEIGGGTGRYGLKMATDFPDSQVFITDILQESLDFISALSSRMNLRNIIIKQEDIFNLSFPDNSFDLVFCDVVIQHLSNPHDAVKEMVRVLRPGGRIIISAVNFWNIPHTIYKAVVGKKYQYGYEKSYKLRELKKICQDTDLKLVATDGFYFAYGLFRLKYIHNIFRWLGVFLNRFIKILDKLSNRFFSKKFGFEIVVIGEK